jgi:cation transport ATPase
MASPAVLAEDPTGLSWSVASDLPGRLRIRSQALVRSALLRHHCKLVLTSCHWLVHFRINPLAGSLCVAYPQHRKRDLLGVLEQALTLGSDDDRLAPLPPAAFSGLRVRRTLIHGTACVALISLESVLALPGLVMVGLTTVLLLPLAREVLHKLRQRQLTVESLELSFSGVLVSQGLTAEALLDLAFGDAVEVVQSAVEREGLDLDANHLLQRLSERVSLNAIDVNGEQQQRLLKDIKAGDTVSINCREHCLLSAQLLSGELIVVNRLVDGDWRPQRLVQGDLLKPGALVISGDGTAKIEHCMQTDPAFSLLRDHSAKAEPEPSQAERWVNRYKRVMPPLLLSLGGTLLTIGSTEAALATFQFNPLSDWEEQKLASQLTTIADLNLHNLRIRKSAAVENIGKIRHLIISRSCLDRIGGIQVREHISNPELTSTGSLVQLLAGLQHWICGTDGASIWSQQLQKVADPVAIQHVEIRHLLEGWTITASDGRCWEMRQQAVAQGEHCHTHLNPLEIWQDNTLLGTVALLSEPDQHWRDACASLRDLGIEIHLIASEELERLDQIATELGIDKQHRHGLSTASDRLELVQSLQQSGGMVGYVGYVLHDLPALAQADVSVGLDVDDDSRYLANICDLALGADALWLPRLIRMSRSMQRACDQNFSLLGATQLASSLATAAGWIAPLQTVLLGDVPLLLAELNNLLALQTPKPMVAEHSAAFDAKLAKQDF